MRATRVRSRGRPALGHVGHRGQLEGCEPLTVVLPGGEKLVVGDEIDIAWDIMGYRFSGRAKVISLTATGEAAHEPAVVAEIEPTTPLERRKLPDPPACPWRSRP